MFWVLQSLNSIGAGLKAAASLDAGQVAKAVFGAMGTYLGYLLTLLQAVVGLETLINAIRAAVKWVMDLVRGFIDRIIAWLFRKCRKCNQKTTKPGTTNGSGGTMMPPKTGSSTPGGKSGRSSQCFSGSTLLSMSGGEKTLIKAASLGQRVTTWQLGESGYESSLLVPDTVIEPATWRVFWLVQEDGAGHRSEVGLLRPEAWLTEQGATKVGDRLLLQMPEMSVEGVYQLMTIKPCPEIERGAGRVITGLYRFRRGQVWDLQLSGEEKPIGVTDQHPVWSVDRTMFVLVNRLEVGERVSVREGEAIVLGLTKGREEPVYNIEVDGDHCYRVGQQGVLVHNASTNTCVPKTGDIVYGNFESVALTNGTTVSRATRGHAYITPSSVGGHSEFNTTPMWWDLLNPANSRDRNAWQASHIIGGQLGGAGSPEYRNLLPLYRRANNPGMRTCETFARRLAEECGLCVSYSVTPVYNPNPNALLLVVSALIPSEVIIEIIADRGPGTANVVSLPPIRVTNDPNAGTPNNCRVTNLPAK